MVYYEYTSTPPSGGEADSEDAAALWARYGDGRSGEAMDRLVEHYIPLLYRIAERMAEKLPDFIDIEDLISWGGAGLVRAIQHYESGGVMDASTFCKIRIRHAILDELRRLDWAPRSAR